MQRLAQASSPIMSFLPEQALSMMYPVTSRPSPKPRKMQTQPVVSSCDSSLSLTFSSAVLLYSIRTRTQTVRVLKTSSGFWLRSACWRARLRMTSHLVSVYRAGTRGRPARERSSGDVLPKT